MQNILIINGSPRKNGNISKMLEAIKKEAEKQGANVSAIHVHDLQIKPWESTIYKEVQKRKKRVVSIKKSRVNAGFLF